MTKKEIQLADATLREMEARLASTIIASQLDGRVRPADHDERLMICETPHGNLGIHVELLTRSDGMVGAIHEDADMALIFMPCEIVDPEQPDPEPGFYAILTGAEVIDGLEGSIEENLEFIEKHDFTKAIWSDRSRNIAKMIRNLDLENAVYGMQNYAYPEVEKIRVMQEARESIAHAFGVLEKQVEITVRLV